MRLGAVTDVGKVRKQNEDSMYADSNALCTYAVVADGMGGHQAGEVASSMAVDIIKNYIHNCLTGDLDYVEASEILRQGFIRANSMIYAYARDNYKVMGMGTTATAAMLFKNKLITAHVGDSRCYLIKNGIRQITRDHSYVQELVMRGEITPEQAKHHPKRNYITRAMGTEETVKVDIGIYDYHGGIVLLCSDGLTTLVEDKEIEEVVEHCGSLQTAAESLVEMANQRGGNDNITVAAIETEEGAADHE